MITSGRQILDVISQGKFFPYLFDSNKWRTLLANLGIFLPVSKRRWQVAQKAERHLWSLPEISESKEHSSFDNESIKSDFIITNSMSRIGLTFEDLLTNKIVVDIGCGPASAIFHSSAPKRKIGVDPMKFPHWVYERYQESGFELINKSIEDLLPADFKNLGDEAPLVIMYNALQHFMDPFLGLNLLKNLLPKHDLLIIEYANTPADDAHPQIITRLRTSRMLKKLGYQTEHIEVILIKKDGLVEAGQGSPAKILVVKANLDPTNQA
jgi:hypothetical protein